MAKKIISVMSKSC